jgi:flagellin-like protein
MKANRKFMDEEAVSPVIGVILMVAITVILAAVIAAFVFGMGGTLKKTYNVAATAQQTNATVIEVTFNGGPDADLVTWFNATGSSSTGGELVAVTTGSNYTGDGSAGSVNVGSILRVQTATGARDHLIATASFEDGTTQIILDTYV